MFLTGSYVSLVDFIKTFFFKLNFFIEILKRKHIDYEENNVVAAGVANCLYFRKHFVSSNRRKNFRSNPTPLEFQYIYRCVFFGLLLLQDPINL